MGEAGRIASTFVFCPPTRAGLEEDDDGNSGNDRGNRVTYASIASGAAGGGAKPTESPFVVDGSGLSTDVASSVRNRPSTHSPSEIPNRRPLEDVYPITVTPIDPPVYMEVNKPVRVRLKVVRHDGRKARRSKGGGGSNGGDEGLQVQFRLPQMKGVVVCGPSFLNVGDAVGEEGVVVVVTLVAMVPGLFFVKGCYVVNLRSRVEVKQPALFSVFVDGGGGEGGELVDL